MSEELSMKDLQMKSLTEKIEMMLKGLDKSKRQEMVKQPATRQPARMPVVAPACALERVAHT